MFDFYALVLCPDISVVRILPFQFNVSSLGACTLQVNPVKGDPREHG
jgi:hypothetical protein